MSKADEPPSAIGDQIRAAREARGLSQAELGSAIGTTQQTIDRIERSAIVRSAYRAPALAFLGLSTADDAAPAISEDYPPLDRRFGRSSQYRKDSQVPVFAVLNYPDVRSVVAEEPSGPASAPLPLTRTDNSYGLIVHDWQMSPAYEPRNIILMNPNVTLLANDDVLFARRVQRYWQIKIARVISFEGDPITGPGSITIRQWANPGTDTLDPSEWSIKHVVVAKYADLTSG